MTDDRLIAIGSTGILVSPLGLGTVKFGRNQGVKYPTAFELPSDRAIADLLAKARELGINLLDTAPAYGSSEERVGKAIDRSDWLLCTKVGEEFDGRESCYDFSGEHTVASIHRSLKRLKTDYLDIVLVHSNGDDMQIIEQSDCLSTLDELKREGLIRSFGMSTKTVAGGRRAVDFCDLVMVTYNPSEPADASVIEKAHREDKGIFIKKAFNSGNSLNASTSTSPATMEFIFSTAGVSSVIVGTLNARHLEENYLAALKASANRAT